ncbi:MAG: PAS domain S-box protein [Candidatus Brocadia sp.]
MERTEIRTADFSTDGFIRRCFETIIRGGNPQQDAVFRLNKYLSKRKLALNRHLMAIALVDKNGRVVSSTDERLIGKDFSRHEIFLQGIRKNYGETYIGQLQYFPDLDANCTFVSAPIVARHGGETLGVIINAYSLSALNEITTKHAGMGETGEVYLVNRDKLILTQSRFIDDAVGRQIVDTEPVRKLIEDGTTTVGIYRDYRGIAVVGASVYLSKYGWTLLAEIDKAESFAPLKRLGLVALFFGIVSVVAVTGLGISFAASTSSPIRDLKDAAERFAGGDLDYRVKVTRRDEIGVLAKSFNAMAEELKREISGHRRAEKVLKESEQRFRTIFDSATDGILISDRETKKVYTGNKAICQILGYPAEEIKDLGIEDIHPREDMPFVMEQFEKQAKGENVLAKDVPVKRKDGNIFYADINTSLVTFDGKTYLMGIFRDVTERKRAEEALRVLNESLEQRIEDRTAALVKANKELKSEISERRRVEEELRKLFNAVEQSSCSVVITDKEGNIEYVNPKFSRVTGYAPEEVIGENPRILKSGEKPPEEYKCLWDTITSGGEWEGEFHNKKKNGELYWEYASISPIRNPEGAITHFVAIKEDITERKRTEEELRKQRDHLEYLTNRLAAANKELEAFCYSVSHDLRAPLRGIDGFSRALLEDYSDRLDSQGKNYLQRVCSASKYMGQLIDDLLNLSRITRGEMSCKKVNLSALAKVIASELQEAEPGRQAEFIIAEKLVVNGDPHLLQIALKNLLSNAWKFTRKRPRTIIEFGVKQHDGKPVYFVRDNGAGFDMAYANKLFGAFQRLHSTTEFEGTGIGLATVQRIIHRHGGQIWAEGAVDQGATFYFSI